MNLKKILKILTVLVLILSSAFLLFSCSGLNSNKNQEEEITSESELESITDSASTSAEQISETSELTELTELTELIELIETTANPPDYLTLSQTLNAVYKSAWSSNTAEPQFIDLAMDIYYPANKIYEKSPVVIGFHGGGWIAGDKSQLLYLFAPVIAELRDKGYTFVTVQYRFATDKVYFPAQIQDCTDAVLYLKNNAEKYNIDINSIGLMGYSAGAHLAMLSSYAMPQFSETGETADIKYCISFAGPTKMYDDDAKKYSRSTLYLLENLFHGTYEEKQEDYKKGSPYYYIDKTQKTPLLLVQDEQDDVVPFSQSELMFDKFTELNIPCQLIKLTKVKHQIDFRESNNASISDALDKISAFIYKYSEK